MLSKSETAYPYSTLVQEQKDMGIVGRVGRATARDALCHGFDPCRQRPRGVAMDFGPKQSGWLINQLCDPCFFF
jgi:hypothetical protein